MNRFFHRRLFLPLMLLAVAGISVSLRAGPGAAPAPAASAATVDLPVLQPPLKLFRDLLAMTPAQRQQHLAQWTPEKRARVLAKLREYEAMTPAAREESLKTTELHWYLQHFLSNDSTNNNIQLSQVPEPYRQMVSDRLNVWKILPPQIQQDVMEHEAARDTFSERLAVWKILPPQLQQEILAHENTRDFFLLGNRVSASAEVPPQIIPPPLKQELIRLDSLQPGQREQAYANFENFFALTASEKKDVLVSLSAAERRQFAKTVADLEQLPREQRELRLHAISRLAGLSDQQRMQFFNSVSRWKQLSPVEQKLWIEVASHLPPPPNPGISASANP
jgi:hypothetical protein